jgi:hypothetical protein
VDIARPVAATGALDDAQAIAEGIANRSLRAEALARSPRRRQAIPDARTNSWASPRRP